MKRILATVLVLCLALGAVPLYGFATEEEDLAARKEGLSALEGQAVNAIQAVTAANGAPAKPVDGVSPSGQVFPTDVSTNFRIPGLVTFKGNLIATADARWDNEKDGGGLDLVVARSANGTSWNYTFAGYLGDNGNVYNADSSTLMDPVIVTDGTTLYLFADMYPAGYSISAPSTTNVFSDTNIGFDGNGNLLLSADKRQSYGYYLKDGKIYSTANEEQSQYTVDGWFDLYENGEYLTNLFFADSPFQVRATSYICMSTSTDGVNWSDPVLLNVKPQGVNWMVLGPGSGIVTSTGYVAFTAYDNSNIYLIYGKDGVWNRVQTNAAGNESSIIELNDGTIRAFVKRGGSNTIAYVDFTKTNNGYTAGSLVDTGVTNFSQCMVSSLHYSKTYQGKEVVLVCCPSKPGAGAWNGRFNGKIHMFTLDDSNNMTHVKSYALNGTSDFFAYSNMAELNDGTIGVLYEDDCISYSAGSYTGKASHITYTTVNLETVMGVTFDTTQTPDPEPETPAIYTITDATTDVMVNFAPTDVTGWTMTVTPDQTVNGLATYRAFDITVTDDEGTRYTGAAEVKLPMGTVPSAGAYPFVVEANGTVTKIDNFIIKDGYITFRSPHFSVVGVAVDNAPTITGEDIVSSQGGAGTPAGYYLATDGFEDGEKYLIVYDDSYALVYFQGLKTATVTVEGDKATVTGMVSAGLTLENVTVDWVREGNYLKTLALNSNNYLTITRNSLSLTAKNGSGEIDAQSNGNGYVLHSKYYGYWDTYLTYNSNNQKFSASTNSGTTVKLYKYQPEKSSTVWTVEPNEQAARIEAYTLTDNTGYTSTSWDAYQAALTAAQTELENVRNGQYATEADANEALADLIAEVDALEAAKAALVAKVTITVYYQHNGATIYTETHVLAADAQSLTLLESVEVGGLIYRPNSATLTLTGDLTYVVPVYLPGEETRKITLYVGHSKTDTIDGVAYTDANVTQEPDDTKVTIGSVVGSTVSGDKQLVEVTAIESGKQYLLVNNRAQKTLAGTEQDGKLILDGTATVSSHHVWTITNSSTLYTVQYAADGTYLTVGNGSSGLSSSETKLYLAYQADGYWYICDANNIYGLNDFGGTGTVAGGWNGRDVGSQWKLYEIVETDAVTKTDVTFTGVTPGQTTAKIGATTYEITVYNPREGDIGSFNNIIGTKTYDGDNRDVELTGKKITALTIDADPTSSFQLGVDLADADMVEWSVADPTIATVDENGNVFGQNEGETTVTAKVYKNGVYETISIPVYVIPSLGTSDDMTTVCYYVENLIDTNAWYSLYSAGVTKELQSVVEGQVIFFRRPVTTSFGMVWVAAPHDGYALTYMAASGSDHQYYPLHDGTEDADKNHTLKTDNVNYYAGGTVGGNPYYNLYTSYGVNKAALDAMLTNAVKKEYGADGAMSMGRKVNDGVPKLGTELTFISEKIATVEKTVHGILPVSRQQKDYCEYYTGMIATTGELLYFRVTLTLERPHVWENNDEAAGIAALQYSEAKLTDLLGNAYFYTKQLDQDDGSYDGLIAEASRTNTQTVTDQLNAAWAADETQRVVEFYVVYEIQEEDIPKYVISNEVEFDYGFRSLYTKTDAVKAAAATVASVTVVQTPINPVVIDFCQPITITGLDNKHLKFAFGDGDVGKEGYSAPTANYGTVEVTKTPVDENGDGVTDIDGNRTEMYTYTVTYTPTKILLEPDTVHIYGRFYDDKLEDYVTKVVGGFTVYPATTIHYEESFISWSDGEWTGGAQSVIGSQHMDYLGDVVTDKNGTPIVTNGQQTIIKPFNYGYDEVNLNKNQASNGTEASTNILGARGSFTFNGTGFEIYANCTKDTGHVMVLVAGNDDGTTRLYTVNTAVDAGSTPATNQQTTSYYSVPIVSVQDLPHGNYTVTIVKSVDTNMDASSQKTVYIDGIRIFGTAPDERVYETDGEANPQYVELRDLVLTVANVEQHVSNGQYSTADQIISQVYSDTGTLGAVVWLNGNPDYAITDNLEDLLENGPKNELYLWPGQAVTFNLTGTAQIGMKTVSGSKVDYTYANDGVEVGTFELNSSTDMFYHDGSTGAVTISNTGATGVLSITLLKYWGTTQANLLSEVTKEQVTYAITTLRGPAVEESKVATLTVNYVTQAGHKTISFGDRVIALPDRKIETVTLTKVQTDDDQAVFTAEEIREALPAGAVVRDLKDITVPYGQSATRTFFASQANSVQGQMETYVITRVF